MITSIDKAIVGFILAIIAQYIGSDVPSMTVAEIVTKLVEAGVVGAAVYLAPNKPKKAPAE